MSQLAYSSPVKRIRYLRISLTELCNFRCLYCRDGKRNVSSDGLTADEIELVVKVFSEYGLQTVRFTGGEPLLRDDVVEIVARVRKFVEDITLTTNGFLLDKYAEPLRRAGLKRLNVSLDSLNEEKFKWLTGGDLKRVLKGLEAARRAGFKGIKLNTVAIKNFTEEEVDDLLKFSAEGGYHLRFIELMPVGNLPFFKEDRFLPLDKLKEYIVERYGELIPLDRSGSGASKDFYLPSLGIKVGFIKAITEPFCEGCEKFRITPDGRIHFCLRTDNEVNLKEYLTDEEKLRSFIPELLRMKTESNAFITKHGFKWFINDRSMISLGG
jgi:cyclic pyranopterin phosphate synthase